MNILVLNCGSSSVKFQVFCTDWEMINHNTDYPIASGVIERIGSEALLTFRTYQRGKPDKLFVPLRRCATTKRQFQKSFSGLPLVKTRSKDFTL